MKQLVIVPTGIESLMFERAYPKDAELGSDDYKFFQMSRPALIEAAVNMRGQLVMPAWRRTIDIKDKGTEFSYNFPSKKFKMSPQISEEIYLKLEKFAEKNCLSLVESIMLLIRNYTAVLYEQEDLISQPVRKEKGPDTRKPVLLKLSDDAYSWYTMQAVKKGISTGRLCVDTLTKVYEKNVSKETMR